MPITKYECRVCGKLTAGRLPRGPWEPGDGSLMYPRRHPCPSGRRDTIRGSRVGCAGNILPAIWVTVDERGNLIDRTDFDADMAPWGFAQQVRAAQKVGALTDAAQKRRAA